MVTGFFRGLIEKVKQAAAAAQLEQQNKVAQFNDPIASKTVWGPLKSGGANFRTHTLVKHDPTIMEFKSSIGMKLFFGLFLVVGLIMLFITGVGIFVSGAQIFDGIGIVGAVGLLFTLVGSWLLVQGTAPIVFDLARSQFRRGRADNDIEINTYNPKGAIPLSRIHAFQILRERVSGNDSSYWSYELNLVLDDASRVNVIDHGNLERIRQDAQELATILGKPVWDVA